MKARVILCDDDGNVLPDSPSTAYGFELGGQNLDDIEQEVEPFCHQAQLELTPQPKGTKGATVEEIVRAYAAAIPC